MKRDKLVRSILSSGIVIILIFTFGIIASAQEIKIKNQIWAKANLNINTFRNGDTIQEAKSGTDWQRAGNAKEPVWCFYDFDPGNGIKFGRLYNWFAVSDSRGLSPKGWHIPSESDWRTLISNLGGESLAGTESKNSNGFAGLPGGYCFASFGVFLGIGQSGNWWSSTEGNMVSASFCELSYEELKLITSFREKVDGLSIRCLKD